MSDGFPLRWFSAYGDWVKKEALHAAATALSGRETAPTAADIVTLAKELEPYLDARTDSEKRGVRPKSPGELRH